MRYPTQTNRLDDLLREARGKGPKRTLAEKRKMQEHLFGFHPQEDDKDCPSCYFCQLY